MDVRYFTSENAAEIVAMHLVGIGYDDASIYTTDKGYYYIQASLRGTDDVVTLCADGVMRIV